MTAPPRILYCNCSYAQVVPKEVKEQVLRRLCESGMAFDAVADLCDMSARKDPAMKKLVESGAVRIAACYPRAVRWLFHAAQAPLPPSGVEVLNMREQSADQVVRALTREEGAG
jgi:heterodisulfide reductase subunit A-like polyferredoxin